MMTSEKAIQLLHRLQDEQFDGQHGDERREALEMAVRALEQNLVQESGSLVQDLVKDCISRQAAIDALNKHIDTFDAIDTNYLCGLRTAMSILKEMPSAQTHWIPCSERLPKYPFRVQIQLDNGWIITGYYSEEHWYTVPHCDGFLRNDEVEAWRKLPEPYGGSDAK